MARTARDLWDRARARRFAAAAVALAAIVLGMGACSSSDEEQGGGVEEGSGAGQQVRTTRVEVVEGLGKKGGLDARELYDRLSPGVVTIRSIFANATLLGEEGDEGGQGSGFVLDGEGHIATNAHVVTSGAPPQAERAKEVYVQFSDGNTVPAKVVGDDPNADIALIKIDPAGLELTPLRLGRSSDLAVGEPVAAIGSPFGEPQSLSLGVVSALERTIESLTEFQIGNAIQTDAAINPGNSGGPLLNAKGEVLGINSQIKSTSGGGEGVGFAVPVDTVRRSLEGLRSEGRVDYGYLGVKSQSLYPQLARRLGLPGPAGALIVNVEPGSPADDADLRSGGKRIEFQGQKDIPSGSDAIVAVDGRKLTLRVDLAELISTKQAGEEVELEVFRRGERRTVTVELGTRPERLPDP